jgi:hypothetical protein
MHDIDHLNGREMAYHLIRNLHYLRARNTMYVPRIISNYIGRVYSPQFITSLILYVQQQFKDDCKALVTVSTKEMEEYVYHF